MYLYVQVSIAKMSLVWLRPLVFASLINVEPYTWIFCCLLVLWRSCIFGLQQQPLHMLQQIIYGVDLGVDHFIILVLDLGNCRAGRFSSSLLFSHQFELSSMVLAISPLAAMSKG